MQKRMMFFLIISIVFYIENASAASKVNVIYLIGDGMGVAYTSAYRYYQNSSATHFVEPTIFDEMLVGSASTYPDDEHDNITDSAAAATALASQVKTFNGAIGVNRQYQPVLTLLEIAKQQGYFTGIVVTSQINHATPAAFVAHADSRLSYSAIADQYFDLRINNKLKVDILFGGGQDYFIRRDRNLVKEFVDSGYTYENDLNHLDNIKKMPAIGLFAPVGLTAAIDSDHPLRLAEMTQKALNLFSQKPFFLMLEASQIDWCGHANDIACAMAEMRDMAETMSIIKRYIQKNPNTIFVATADHSTGGLSLGARGEYHWFPNVIRNIKASSAVIAQTLIAHKADWKNAWMTLTGIELNDVENKKMHELLNTEENEKKKDFPERVRKLSLMFIDKYSGTGWTSDGHTGEDVQVFSYGKNKNNFNGAMDNTDIPKRLSTYIYSR